MIERDPIAGACRALSIAAVIASSGACFAQGETPFVDEAVARGIDYTVDTGQAQFGCGVALVDLEGDGDADAIVSGRSDGVVGVYENDGTGHFIDRSAISNIPVLMDVSGVTAADYDGDGDLDLYFSQYLADDVLVRNDTGFTFTDVTTEAGILPGGAGMGCAWADYDNDGRLDLYVSNRTLTNNDWARNRLYRNLGDGTFEEVAGPLGLTDGDAPTLLCAWIDYDRDGDADLYLGNDKGTGASWDNALFENLGGGTFIEVTEQTNTAANVDCMGIAWGDFDLNGWPDLYVTNTPPGNVLLMADGNGAFIDETLAAGVGSYAVGWGCQFFDYDHDRWPELYVCNMQAPNRFYRHQGTFPCTDIGPTAGVADEATSYCMALADVDLDGDQDLMVQSFDQPIRLYMNHQGHLTTWVKLDIVGQGEDRRAVGATALVTTAGVTQQREVTNGANYKSQNEHTLHFGMANETIAEKITVHWPGGTSRVILDMPVNESWTIYPPERLGDADNDGDVDKRDLAAAVRCYTGPGPGNMRPGCELFDMDSDGDVDVDDFMAMGLRRFGPR